MTPAWVLGLDLDGTCADFYGRMREIAAEWVGKPMDELTDAPGWGLKEWGLLDGEYERLHRFAVTQRDLFRTIEPMPGAAQAVRRLGTEGVRIRIITHRLFIRYFHETAVAQTVRWLDHHAIPYWDLCFMREKRAVGADLYVEDSPENIRKLLADGARVLVFNNSTNINDDFGDCQRVSTWEDAEQVIRSSYYEWLKANEMSLPPAPGVAPAWSEDAPKPVV